VNLSILAVSLGALVFLLFSPGTAFAFYLMLALSLVFGLMLVLPIAAADMRS
jgi:NAD/NADP transhydrogenase beta subunit